MESPQASYEFFGFFKRVRPAMYTPGSRRNLGAQSEATQDARRGQRRGRGGQAALEDAGDRCAKAFPKQSELTDVVFRIVCPHVVTLSFRVMFEA